MLPEVAPSDTTRGRLSAAAASQLGAVAGTPVTVGRADTAAALVGSGAAVSARMTQLSIGTGGQLCHGCGESLTRFRELVRCIGRRDPRTPGGGTTHAHTA